MQKPTIQSQFKNTNIETFINGFHEVAKKHSQELINQITNDILNLRTAKGIGLDLWGRLLGFPRYLPAPAEDGSIDSLPFNFYEKTFYKLQFKSQKEKFTYVELDDTSYSIILQSLALRLTTDATMPSLNALSNYLFSSLGGSSFVEDPQNMSFANYIFNFEVPKYLSYVLDNYKIIPTPAGVGFKYLENIAYYIGFDGQDSFAITGKTEFTNFYKARFYPMDYKEVLKNKILDFAKKSLFETKMILNKQNLFLHKTFKNKLNNLKKFNNKSVIYYNYKEIQNTKVSIHNITAYVEYKKQTLDKVYINF